MQLLLASIHLLNTYPMQPLTSLITTFSVMYHDYYMYIYMHTWSDFPTITSYFIHKINVIHTHYNIIHPNPFISHAHNYTSITHLTHKTLIAYLRPPIKHFSYLLYSYLSHLIPRDHYTYPSLANHFPRALS